MRRSTAETVGSGPARSFPGAELVLDAFSPLHIWITNLHFPAYKLDTRLRFGMWDGRKIEAWGDGIRLAGDWGPFDQPEPRMAHFYWMRRIWLTNRIMRIYRFQLGKPA